MLNDILQLASLRGTKGAKYLQNYTTNILIYGFNADTVVSSDLRVLCRLIYLPLLALGMSSLARGSVAVLSEFGFPPPESVFLS